MTDNSSLQVAFDTSTAYKKDVDDKANLEVKGLDLITWQNKHPHEKAAVYFYSLKGTPLNWPNPFPILANDEVNTFVLAGAKGEYPYVVGFYKENKIRIDPGDPKIIIKGS